MISQYDREALRRELRKIDLDSHKPSSGLGELYENSGEKTTTYTEDKILDVIQYLRGDSGRNGKTRMEVMSEHQKGSYEINRRGDMSPRNILHEEFMREKRDEDKLGNRGGYGASEYMTASVPQSRSLDDIKAEFINEMNKLTQKYQEEINNLR